MAQALPAQTSQGSQEIAETDSSTSSSAGTNPIVLPIKILQDSSNRCHLSGERRPFQTDTSLVIKNEDVTLTVAPLQMASEGSQGSFETDPQNEFEGYFRQHELRTC
jgi:hypothetical protein